MELLCLMFNSTTLKSITIVIILNNQLLQFVGGTKKTKLYRECFNLLFVVITRFINARSMSYIVIIALLLYLLMIVFSDYTKILNAVSLMGVSTILLSLALILCSYFFRFVRWVLLTKTIHIKLSFSDSVLIFGSGLSMSITPGKMGELLKSYLIKRINKTPISRSAMIIVFERLTDVLALIIISLSGMFVINHGFSNVVIFALFVMFIILLVREKITYVMLSKLPFIKRFTKELLNCYDSSKNLFVLKNLIINVFISVLAWFLECLGVLLLIQGFNVNNAWLTIPIYAFSSVFGSLSFLPGGLGIMEVSLSGLLVSIIKAPIHLAIAVTIIARLLTLWFSVLIGVVSLFIFNQKISD